MTSEDMALTLVGLARQGVRSPHSAAPSGSFLESLPRTLLLMDSTQIANCMWALGKYGILWESLTPKVQKSYEAAITRAGPKMTPFAIANTIHGKVFTSDVRILSRSFPSSTKLKIIINEIFLF